MSHPVEALLRPKVEYWTAVMGLLLAMLAWVLQSYMLFTPSVGMAMAVFFLLYGTWRGWQAYRVSRYQRCLNRVQSYRLPSHKVPVNDQGLFVGKGFEWCQRHTQRLRDTRSREGQAYINKQRLFGKTATGKGANCMVSAPGKVNAMYQSMCRNASGICWWRALPVRVRPA